MLNSEFRVGDEVAEALAMGLVPDGKGGRLLDWETAERIPWGTLVLFGGAGSLHGPLLAHELGIRRMLVPRTPSVFCAFGGLVSELVHDVVATAYGLDADGAEVARRTSRRYRLLMVSM